MYGLLINGLLLTQEKEATPAQMAIFGAIMVVIVGFILISGKKKSNTIPKKLMDKYTIKASQAYGYGMLFITEDKIVVQDNLKWFEYNISDIKKAISSHRQGRSATEKQYYIEFRDKNDKVIKGPKVFGGGVAVSSAKSFFIYSSSQKDVEAANKALKLIKDNFANIEVLVEI